MTPAMAALEDGRSKS